MPLTTLPSKASFSPPRLSLSMAAKSSRVGKVVVAIEFVVFRNQRACRVTRHHGGPSHADLVKCTAATGSSGRGVRSEALHGKKRVPVPVSPGPYALAEGRASAAAEWSIRRTVEALAKSAQQGKDRLQPPDDPRPNPHAHSEPKHRRVQRRGDR